ncbi:MAG: SLC13 family permease, partial [Dehalococcoidia bacterium]|nr:SLC13 family permease [Dehalococcoidia bacterium]
GLVLIMRWIDGPTYGKGFDYSTPLVPETPPYDTKAIWRLAPVLLLVMTGFFLSSTVHVSIPLIALTGAAAALMLGRTRPDKVLQGVNWLLLLFFAGLFVVIEGAHKAGVLDVFINRVVVTPGIAGIASVHAVSTVVSQLVSNVPLTMLVIPLLKSIPGDTLWIALAAGSTLGGNLTIIGAVANIIVVEGAGKEGVNVGFVQFVKVGVLVTVATILLSILVLSLEFQMGWLK